MAIFRVRRRKDGVEFTVSEAIYLANERSLELVVDASRIENKAITSLDESNNETTASPPPNYSCHKCNKPYTRKTSFDKHVAKCDG